MFAASPDFDAPPTPIRHYPGSTPVLYTNFIIKTIFYYKKIIDKKLFRSFYNTDALYYKDIRIASFLPVNREM